jgi:hypothetical protein
MDKVRKLGKSEKIPVSKIVLIVSVHTLKTMDKNAEIALLG